MTEYPLEDANEALLDVKTAALNGRAVLRVGEPVEIVLNGRNRFDFFFRQDDNLGGNFRHAAYCGSYRAIFLFR